jgi:putative ATP-dependent endonuclease of OLD family
MIEELYILNYKSYRTLNLPFKKGLNIIVGDNEAGKSTILEAINLALTCRLNGRQAVYELSPYLFNKDCVADYLAELKAGKNPDLPSIVVELYLDPEEGLERLQGTNNSKKEDCPGLRLEISFDDDYRKEYEELITKPNQIRTIPIEYYSIKWCSFSFDGITSRSLPVGVSFIDATTIRLQTGTDYYLQTAINDSLDSKEKAGLSLAYRGLKEEFAQQGAIESINNRLSSYQSIISNRALTISIDISQKANWETGLIPYLDNLPFHYIGRGEQSIIKTLFALERKADKTQVILIEEPENHLSYSSMTKLVKKVSDSCDGKQIILTTHSPYVLNKLGLEKLILLFDSTHTSLTELPLDTQDYFMKLPGYDTLRLILAKKVLLVEGPSDELVVQRAYKDAHSGSLPLDDGIDVMSVRGLSFKRFLDIAKELKNSVSVITDNDGDYKKNIKEKYSVFEDVKTITIFYDKDDTCKTLEPQLVKVNGREALNTLLSMSFATDDELIKYMVSNKTEYALRIFESHTAIKYPQYILDAVK